MDRYEMIFKRKSFHKFNQTEKLSASELADLQNFIDNEVQPLEPGIRTAIHIVPADETSCKRGEEYCIVFYTEDAKRASDLRNIGYIGQQIDLYCTEKNIGTLWFGMGKAHELKYDGLEYVILIAIAKVPEDTFRKDMFKAKRKPLAETWSGPTLDIAEIARFAPSACNSQPWVVESAEDEAASLLKVYRNRRAGKIGIIPVAQVSHWNRVDMGIYLCILEACITHEGYTFERTLITDESEAIGVNIPNAEYKLSK